MIKKIIYAADYRGVELKNKLVQQHNLTDVEFEDIGIESGSVLDYVDISKKLAEKLRNSPDCLGVIICGSGQGVAIALNRFSHMRAVMCRTVEDALQTREKLNANVVCLGSRYTSEDEARKIIESFINGSFKTERHGACVQKLATNQTGHINEGVNLIVRAIIMHKGHVLLSTATKENSDFPQNLFFLPGGHVEYNESAIDALKREIMEEMNLEISNDIKFIDALECSWNRKSAIYHELDLVYRVEIDDLDLSNPPVSMDHKFHTFVWKSIDQLKELTILPEALKSIIEHSLDSNNKPKVLSQMITQI